MNHDFQKRHETLAIATFKLREAEKRFVKYKTGAARDKMYEAQKIVDKLLVQEGEIIRKQSQLPF